jgi:hypothetical protein
MAAPQTAIRPSTRALPVGAAAPGRLGVDVSKVGRLRIVLLDTWHLRPARSPDLWLRNGTSPKHGLRIGPVSRVSKGPETHRARERDLPVTAEAIMTSTAATAIAMIHRTQSMPGLPLPPNAV